MIKYTENGTTQNIIKVMKDGHEAHRMLHNDRLVFSPFLIMGTTYESTSKQMWSRGDNSQLGTDLYATFEILGTAGSDSDGTYYYFGFRCTGLRRDGNMAGQTHFSTEINYFFNQNYSPLTTYFRTVDQFNCTGNYTLGAIPRLGQRTGLKEVDFKWFNCKDMNQFCPLAFSTNCTSVKNLDKITFNRSIQCSEAFRECAFDTFVWYSNTLHYINNLDQTWRNCSNVTLVTFATQEQDNTLLHNLGYTFADCSHVTRIDLANLKPVNLTNCQGTFQGCTALDSNPLGGVDTSGVTNWNSCYRECKAITGGQLSTNDYTGATSMADTFRGCTSIETMDLSGQTLSNLETMSNTWLSCTNLYSVTFPASKVRPKTMHDCFNSTALYGIPANIDFSRCTATDATFRNCTNFEGYYDWSSHDFSVTTNAAGMFYGCSGILGITFASSNAFHNCSNFAQFLERCTLIQYVYNLDLASATNLSSMFYIDGNLKTVTGTKPSGAVQITYMTIGCTSLERFIDFSNIKLKNDSQFNVGMVPKNANDLHIETWTNEDGTGKPVVVGATGQPLVTTTSDTTNAYTIDFTGWTFLSGIRASGGIGSISARSYFPINLNGIKVRMVKKTSDNSLIPIQGYIAYDQCHGLTSIDTTNWLDNSEIPSLTKVVFATNGNMFQRCTNLATIKLKNVMTQENYDGTVNNNNNANTFANCPAVTSFECDIDFINTQRSQALLLNFPLWTNATEIESFLTQLATTNSRRKTHGDGNNTIITFSSNTYNVITSLPNWSTLSSEIVAHGWSIGD